MRPATRFVTPFLACSLMLVGCASPTPTASSAPAEPQPQASTVAEAWLADVTAIAAADDNAGRRAAIEHALKASGIAVTQVPFVFGKHQGTNLLADISGPADAPLLLIGAHSDRVEVGRGATDNASGSAVVLALAQRLKQAPLQNHRVAVAFWDKEELGLIGAHAYIADGGAKPAMYVNFDVFGWGDALWMMTPEPSHPLVSASRDATRSAGITFSPGDKYPPTDHLAFHKAGWPAVSYSLVGSDEIPNILAAFARQKVETPAKVMQVIHSDADTMAQVDATQAARGVDAVEDALRRWDAVTQ
ncbi:peptidase M28-like protein [Luteimonas cucumeris]|uniref:Peptidase M28-like protein n=1 Tax=Luteimonas cucumeris TaxID=985012 RepID=A0A562L8D6_9GAMM|nr:M20/M25/M40 family metallo-hydrolase [Luteimonas cucumeris]TWI03910.1 peptidase M28-like protein [Luteimonas cucumeris]